MEKNELMSLLKKDVNPKAPKEMKKNIVQELRNLEQTKERIPFIPIDSYKDSGILLLLIILSSSFLFVEGQLLTSSSVFVLEKISKTSLELFIISLSALFFVRVLGQLISIKKG